MYSFSSYKVFWAVRYLIILGFVTGMVLISLLFPPFFEGISNLVLWGWVLFALSLSFFVFYYLNLFFFWKFYGFDFTSFKKTLFFISVCVVLFLAAQFFCLLRIINFFDLKLLVVVSIFWSLGTVLSFVGISLSTKFLFGWQKEMLVQQRNKEKKLV